MSIRTYTFALLAAPVVFIVGPLVATSCNNGGTQAADSGDTSTNTDAEENGPCQNGTIQLLDCEPGDGGVVLEHFTDEACDGLDTAETRTPSVHDDTQAPAVDLPTEAQVLASATPFTFTWHTTGFAMRSRPATRAFHWTDDLARWTTLLPAAEAHCSPFGGVAFALNFVASNNQVIFRAETANRSYTPSADAWTRLRAAQGTIALNVEVARFADNDVTEGPFDQTAAGMRHFTITP